MKLFSLIVLSIVLGSLLVQCKSTQSQQSSLSSRMIYRSLKSINFSERTFKRLLTKPKRGTNEISAKKLSRKLTYEEWDIEGFRIITVCPPSPRKKHIIVLHGGAYVAEAVKGHRYLIEQLALKYHYSVSFIDYPLAPENTVETTLRITLKAYIQITHRNSMDTILLFGDSAGGGLALALLQSIKQSNAANLPLKTVLLSPWVDASMSNPEIESYKDKDVLLNVEGLKKCARLYAGKKSLKDPRLSPLFGNLDSLNQISIFVSNAEILYPDCKLLKTKLDAAKGTKASIHIKENMIHDWIILPIKERDETLHEINMFFGIDG